MTVNQVSVRLSDELHNQLTTLAKQMGVAKSKILVYALTDYLQNQNSFNSLETNTVQQQLNQLEIRLLELEKKALNGENKQNIRSKSDNLQKIVESTSTLQIETVQVDQQGEIVHRYYTTIQSFFEPLTPDLGIPMIYLVGGRFEMGSSPERLHSQTCEYPQHSVTVSPFFLSQTPITQAQWRKVASFPSVDRELSEDPSYFQGEDHPVEQVTWEDAVEFCQRLSLYSQRSYRLPTEAEWEYACRAGTTTPFAFGVTLRGDLANYIASRTYLHESPYPYRQQTTPVQSFFPNAFGLYDMHGNVWEWCLDHWHPNYLDAPDSAIPWLSDDPRTRRILRGGSWDFDPQYCRSTARYAYSPTGLPLNQIGFRVVCEG